jgi:hypothetical protein
MLSYQNAFFLRIAGARGSSENKDDDIRPDVRHTLTCIDT